MSGASSYTILAIDDSKKILDIIKYFLENEGYNVKAVGDPFEGIQVAQQGGIDLILLDIMMPGMDGYTVFDNLKKDSRTREVPVVMLTAKAIILHTPKDFFYGLYGFLAKPFSKQQLLKVVSEALRLTKTGEHGLITPVDGDAKAGG
ncbi:MAG TPA: response regulator [Planctomycetota bacterium]|jgi:CheY-like chemotaxis protein|nr:response regulator [Planctomycetota bacterium]